MPAVSRRPNFSVLLGLAWAVAAGLLLYDRWPDMAARLFDTDDAMRLVQVREFLAGAGWFNLHEARLDPPVGYDTHWSRLIDAGLAVLFLIFRPFANAELAEKLMRAVWPLLWLAVAMGSAAAIAWRIAGRNAAVVVLILSAFALPAFQHFRPGRIDHHNVQIALALAVVAATCWADHARHAAALAGALTGLAIAVGLESILFIALCGAALVLRFVIDVYPRLSARMAADYGIALAASTLGGFLVSVAPSHWYRPACDAIAINWLAATVIVGLGTWVIANAFAQTRERTRAVAVAAVVGAAVAAFVYIEPRCIGGPFALTDAMVKTIWLDRVDETEPLLDVMRGFPMMGAWLLAFPFVAILAGALLARDRETRRDFGFVLAAAALVLSVAETFMAVKVYSYAMWFGMPIVAALTCRLTAASGARATAARLAAAVILTPTVITAGAISLAQAAAGDDPVKPGIPERTTCSRNDAYAPLAQLPAGLVATDINYGPFVLALTPHSVVAAPYHRMTGGIIAAHTIMNASPNEARRVIDTYKVKYLAVCGSRSAGGEEAAPGSLRADLNAGRVPQWLEPIPAEDEQLFALYRVAPAASDLSSPNQRSAVPPRFQPRPPSP